MPISNLKNAEDRWSSAKATKSKSLIFFDGSEFSWGGVCRPATLLTSKNASLIGINFDIEKEIYEHHRTEMQGMQVKKLIPKMATTVITLHGVLLEVRDLGKHEACF